MNARPIQQSLNQQFLKLPKGQQIMTNRDVTAFLRDGAIGSAVGGGPWMLFTAPIGIRALAEGKLLVGLTAIFFPVLMAGAIVFASMIIIGLPLTAWLHATNRECPRIYGMCGAIAGMLIPLAILAAIVGPPDFSAAGIYLLPASGLLAGLATAVSWGKHRKCVRNEAREAAEPNPIHDLLY